MYHHDKFKGVRKTHSKYFNKDDTYYLSISVEFGSIIIRSKTRGVTTVGESYVSLRELLHNWELHDVSAPLPKIDVSDWYKDF